MDQKQFPPTAPNQNVGFQPPPAYEQHQNYPQQYQGHPASDPQLHAHTQPQVVTGKMIDLVSTFFVTWQLSLSDYWKRLWPRPCCSQLSKLSEFNHYPYRLWVIYEDAFDGWTHLPFILALLLPAVYDGFMQERQPLLPTLWSIPRILQIELIFSLAFVFLFLSFHVRIKNILCDIKMFLCLSSNALERHQ